MSGVSRQDRHTGVRVRLLGLPSCLLEASLPTQDCWRSSQGTFGPQHTKHPEKKQPTRPREQLQKEEKEEQEVYYRSRKLSSLTLRMVQSCNHWVPKYTCHQKNRCVLTFWCHYQKTTLHSQRLRTAPSPCSWCIVFLSVGNNKGIRIPPITKFACRIT